ncbi:MAG: hypothetical protein J7497_14455 [Chitinophagaceae bacterium]|nr:hypothetical protein [Chitinophagaceae bacterium]
MKDDEYYNKFYSYFSSRRVFKRKDLLEFFHKLEPGLKESTFSWRIFDLKKRNIISDLKTGVYTLNSKKPFVPQISPDIISINKLITQLYDPQFYMTWDTIWINDLTELQATSSQIILEIEKGLMTSVFFTLRDQGFREMFIKPDNSMTERYISEGEHPIIIKPFISRSPAQIVENIKAPSLEKILVDLYCDDEIYFAFQGHQLEVIYRNAVSRYSLNFSTLFTYAKRRSREDEIKTLLMNVLDTDLKEILK